MDHRALCGVFVRTQAGRRVADLAPARTNPLLIGVREGTQFGRKLTVARLGQRFHVQDHAGQAGQVFDGGRIGARDLVAGDGARPDADGALRVTVGRLGMDRGPVADGELDVVPVQHVHGFLLVPVCRVHPVGMVAQQALDKGRAAVRRLDRQLHLEQPRRVLQLGRLDLAIDQEHGHNPVAVRLAHPPLDHDLRVVLVNHPNGDRPFPQRDRVGCAAHRNALPHANGVSISALLRGAGDPFVAPPLRRDAQRPARAIQGKRHPDRRRHHPLTLRHAVFSRPFLTFPGPAHGKLIVFAFTGLFQAVPFFLLPIGTGGDVPLRGEEAAEVTLTHASFRDLLLRTSGRAHELLAKQRLQLLADLGMRRQLKDRRGRCSRFRYARRLLGLAVVSSHLKSPEWCTSEKEGHDT